jgi:phosphate:Na+ symporter
VTPDAVAPLIAQAGNAPIEWASLVMGLLGGLGLFLFGLEQMTVALKAVAGDRMRSVLSKLTTNRFTAMLTGAFVTAVIQSSSVTTVLIVSFISSGLMSLSQSVGVILGANIGTTVTAQIIAFKVTKLALGMIAAGFALAFLSRRESLRHHGNGILALGLVFLGMTVMGEAMAPLRHHPGFLTWMVRMENPLFGILAAAVFTGLVQSSSATTGVVIAMASQGLITLPAGIALIFGANVGTCVTAMLAAIGKPREAVRAAVVHVLFNVIGVLLWIGLIPQLAEWVTEFSPHAPGLTGADLRAADTPRQIANAHTLFNVVNAFVFLPFATLLASIVERLVPDRPLADEEEIRARYLDEALLDSPSLALQRVRLELTHMGRCVNHMLGASIEPVLRGGREDLNAVETLDEPIDRLHEHIITYLGKISRRPLTDSQTDELLQMMDLSGSLESVGDVIETDLVAQGYARIDAGFQISEPTIRVISELHDRVASALRMSIDALDRDDADSARKVVAMKPDIRHLADSAARHEADRLVAPASDRMRAYSIETDIIEHLRRVYYFAKRIAHGVIERAENGSAEADTTPDEAE